MAVLVAQPDDQLRRQRLRALRAVGSSPTEAACGDVASVLANRVVPNDILIATSASAPRFQRADNATPMANGADMPRRKVG